VVRAVLTLLRSGSIVYSNRSFLQEKYARAGLWPIRIRLRTGQMRCFVGGRPSGLPLLLVHGFGAGALETWEKQVQLFARRYQLIIPDLYWFGESQPHAEQEMARPSQHAAALTELLDHLHVKRTHIAGVSFGGFVALQLARRHPQRVRRLVLVSSAGLEPTPDEQRWTSARFGVDDLSRVLIPEDTHALRQFLDAVFYRRRYLPHFVLHQLLRDEFWRHAGEKHKICKGMLAELLKERELSQVRCKTLLVWGRHDPLVLPTFGQRMCNALPQARLVVIDRAAHPPMLEQPEHFNQAVLHFLG